MGVGGRDYLGSWLTTRSKPPLLAVLMKHSYDYAPLGTFTEDPLPIIVKAYYSVSPSTGALCGTNSPHGAVACREGN